MKLKEVLDKLNKIYDELGDLDVVYPYPGNSDQWDFVRPEPFEQDQIYMGFVTEQQKLLTNPENPLTDRPVLVLE
jgi:hypothetical protein